MFNKKANTEMSLETIFKILAVVLIGGVIFYNLYQTSTTDSHVIKSLAVDLALQIDAVQSLRSDAVAFVVFPFPFNVSVKIKDNEVFIKKGGLESKYFFVKNKNLIFENSEFSNLNRLFIYNDGNMIKFSEKSIPFYNFYSCPDLRLNLRKVSIDAGKGFDEEFNLGEKGLIINDVPESLHTLDIALFVANYPFFDLTRRSGSIVRDSFLSVDVRKSLVSDALISLHFGDFDKLIKVYVNSKKESVVFACSILNELKKSLNVKDSAIIPVNFDLISKNDFKQVLDVDKPAVLFVFSKDLVGKKRIIAESIIRGAKL
jgi:hypothetical protein